MVGVVPKGSVARKHPLLNRKSSAAELWVNACRFHCCAPILRVDVCRQNDGLSCKSSAAELFSNGGSVGAPLPDRWIEKVRQPNFSDSLRCLAA